MLSRMFLLCCPVTSPSDKKLLKFSIICVDTPFVSFFYIDLSCRASIQAIPTQRADAAGTDVMHVTLFRGVWRVHQTIL